MHRTHAHRRRRGVSPIIATILLVAIAMVLAAVLYILVSGITNGPTRPSISSALVLGPVAEGQAGSVYYYNISVAESGLGVTWNAVDLEVQVGGQVVSTGITSYTVEDIHGNTVCHATGPTVSGWTAGPAGSGATPIGSAQHLVLQTTTSLTDRSAILQIIGTGGFTGSIQASIP